MESYLDAMRNQKFISNLYCKKMKDTKLKKGN